MMQKMCLGLSEPFIKEAINQPNRSQPGKFETLAKDIQSFLNLWVVVGFK